MLSGNHDNETTLRLLYYPPIIEDDGNKCDMAKGKCKYSQQRCCNSDDEICIPKRDVNEDDDDDDDEEQIKLKAEQKKKKKEATVTRCGAHCDYGTFTLLSQDSEGGLEVRHLTILLILLANIRIKTKN